MLAPRSIAFLTAFGLLLSACTTPLQTTQMTTDSPGATAASPTAAQAAPTPPATPAAAPPPPAAARAARAPTPPPPQPAEQPMTVTRAREQCWMLAENQRTRDLDARVKFVEKCVADKMK